METVFQLHAAGLTHAGQKRSHNEDYIGLFEPSQAKEVLESGCLYVVADGVGGAAYGERASQYAVQQLLYTYYQRTDMPPAQRLKAIIQEIGNNIYTHSQSLDGIRMATTLVAAVIWRDKVIVANVGDSRAYLLRNGQAYQMTRDHNLVAEMLNDGVLSEEEAQKSQFKNHLTRSVGGETNPTVDVFEYTIGEGDRILLCSDGLSRYATPEDLIALATSGTPEESVQRLIDFANQQGGADNISAIVVAVGPRITVDQWEATSQTVPMKPSVALAAQAAGDAPTESFQTPPETQESAGQTPTPPPQKPRKRRWRWLQLFALAVVMGSIGMALGMFGASWANRHQTTPLPPSPSPVSVTQAPAQPTATPVPQPSPTPLPQPSPTPSPIPATPTTIATATLAFPDTPYGCVAIVSVGDTFYNLIGGFYNVSSDFNGFQSAYTFPAIAYIYAPPKTPDTLWHWDDFFSLSVPDTDKQRDDFEEELNTLPILGMGILMPKINQSDCLARGGEWVPIEGLPEWAIYGNPLSPTPTP